LKRQGVDLGGLTFMNGFEPKEGWFMSRSGYTGEDGFEIALPEFAGPQTLVATHAARTIAYMWIGLAARDSLRLEAGLCLHGNDIDPVHRSGQRGTALGHTRRILRENRYAFIGADALREKIADGAKEKRVGLKPEGRQPVRGGAPILDEDGTTVGRVTSGGFGPSAQDIRSPWATSRSAAGQAGRRQSVFAEVRGQRIPISVHALPFTPSPLLQGIIPMAKTYYTEDHEWLTVHQGGEATVGITDYAQEQLGDIVFRRGCGNWQAR
jgi:aminomethyltransferase